MSVTAAQGFVAAGVTAGLKTSGRPDVALVVNRGRRKSAAAVFTSNRAKAHPVLWSQQVVGDGIAEAVVLNSGGANCFTGPFGFQTTHATAKTIMKRNGAYQSADIWRIAVLTFSTVSQARSGER